MLAVIKTGGKQYLVAPGDKIKIEKLGGDESKDSSSPSLSRNESSAKKEGAEVVFSDVLLLEKNKKVEIGDPQVKGVKVIAKVLRQDKAKKVIIFKYKSKKRYQVKKGHRQPFTEVEIVKFE